MLPAKPPLVLIIEDNRYTQRLLTKQLKARDFDILCKDDGKSGLEWLQTNQADIVVLDVILPDADGIDICQQIRQQYPTLPIMLLSAWGSDPIQRARATQAGANDMMAKPYETDELVERLRALLKP